VIYIDYLEKGKTVTGLNYAELLGRFAAELQKIRPHLAKKNVLFHHDNAPAYTSALAKAKLVEFCYPIHHILQIWSRMTSFCFQT